MSEGMTVREAGRRGGQTTSKKHGHLFYESIGRKGGKTVAAKYGHEHYVALGQKAAARVQEIMAAGRAALAREAGDATD